MKNAIVAVQMLIRLTGLIQLILGVFFWMGIAANLVQVHTAVGGLFVLLLWIMAILAIRSGTNKGLAISMIVWGAVVLGLGMTQVDLLPGSSHWVIEALHLLVGVAAIGQAEALGARLKRAGAAKKPA